MVATATHSPASEQVRNPGPVAISGGMKGAFAAMVGIGAVVFLISLQSDPKRAWAAFFLNHFYFMSLAILGGFFAGIHWLTSAMWSTPVRRIYESLTAYLPFAAVTFALLYFGVHHLYLWADVEKARQSPELVHKLGYMSVGFFFVRNLGAIGLWIFLLSKIVGNSIKQDTTKDPALTFKNRALVPAFMVIFALTYTMASFDQVMSLDPFWYSTMFGVYCFAGAFYAMHGFAGAMAVWLKRRGTLAGIINENHFHDLGKYMFAFTIFWAYIGFAQFMLIWYANLPEETGYFIRRFHEGWFAVSTFLLIGKFATPFFLMLPRDSKRNESMVIKVGIFMMIAQWVDVMWMVQPEFFSDGPRFGFTEIGVTVGFIGLFGLAITRFLSKNCAVPIGDPRLAQSVFHHHQ